MRRAGATFGGAIHAVARVLSAERLATEWSPDLAFLVLARADAERERALRLVNAGVGNVGWITSDGVEAGDIVSRIDVRDEAVVHYRESDLHHALFLTNRCNSRCLMCSQPPTLDNDGWRVDEAISIVRHMRNAPARLGITGGEPLLLRGDLRRTLDAIAAAHPQTHVEILTNGRLLADAALVELLLDGLTAPVSWLVPLYGHADFLHDFVVQARGAFDETIAGLLSLQERCQPIQLRIVLIKPVLEVLPELCSFIGRNLPFVREVALMATEPIGFALANREHCQVDLGDWSASIEAAARVLDRLAVPFLFMNAPLCALPRSLWTHAQRSISDWKNVYDAECGRCAVRERCAGLFAWHERGWKPTRVHAIEETSS